VLTLLVLSFIYKPCLAASYNVWVSTELGIISWASLCAIEHVVFRTPIVSFSALIIGVVLIIVISSVYSIRRLRN